MTDIRELVVATVTIEGGGLTVKNNNAALINTVFQKIDTGIFSIEISGDIMPLTASPYMILTSVGIPQQPIITSNSPVITPTTYDYTVQIYDQTNNLVNGTVNLVIYEGGKIYN
jgi:hypothetical protein